MNISTTNKGGLSTFTEIKDRCEKRNTRIMRATWSSDKSVLILIFQDGSQANVDSKTLDEINADQTLFV
jgi:hypothetical protein